MRSGSSQDLIKKLKNKGIIFKNRRMHPYGKRLFVPVFGVLAGLLIIHMYRSSHQWKLDAITFGNRYFHVDSNGLVEIGNEYDAKIIASPIDVINGSGKFEGQDDIRILNYIRKYHLRPPTPKDIPYGKMKQVPHNGGVLRYVQKLFKNQTGGFFIECGANNGEYLSNTLLLEMKYGWTGLLVEGDKDNVKEMLLRNRKAWVADFCLSPVPYPVELNLEKAQYKAMTHVVGFFFRNATKNDQRGTFIAPCFPLYSALRALEVTTVDYFSLDVEGAELPILKTFPFDDSLVIKVISLEYRGNKLEDFDSFLASKGYKRVAIVKESGHTLDAIYVHSSFPV